MGEKAGGSGGGGEGAICTLGKAAVAELCRRPRQVDENAPRCEHGLARLSFVKKEGANKVSS